MDRNITLSEEERLKKIEDILDTKDFDSLIQAIAGGLTFGFFIPILMGKNAFSLFASGFFFLCAIKATYLLFSGGTNIQEKVLYSNDKVNSFIIHTNLTISSTIPTKNLLALPVSEKIGRNYFHAYYIQPLLTIDNIDSFLNNGNYNLKSYRIRISKSEHKELRELLNSDIEEFNKEVAKRGYCISVD